MSNDIVLPIAAVKPTSFIEYPGKVSYVVYTQGCNLSCPYCFNPDLISKVSPYVYTEEEVIEKVFNRKDLIDAVVLTGGEPLIWDVTGFLSEIRKTRLLIGVYTNGTCPDRISTLLEEGLVDFICMSIKTPVEGYCNKLKNLDASLAVMASLAILKKAKIDVEFTTVVDGDLCTEEDVISIRNFIKKLPGVERKHTIKPVQGVGHA